MAHVASGDHRHPRRCRRVPARAPAHRYDLYLYLAAAAVGCGFGALASATTGVERDAKADRLYTRCGPAFAVTWTVAGTRVASSGRCRTFPGSRTPRAHSYATTRSGAARSPQHSC